MIETVKMAGSTYAVLPHKYEAGTPPIAQAIGLGAAVDYLSGLGMAAVAAHEQAITAYALDRLQQVEGLRVIGPAEAVERGGAVSFVLDGAYGPIHSHDVARCSTPSVLPSASATTARGRCATASRSRRRRASFYVYTSPAEVDALVDGLAHVKRYFG
jgi:cysteine desulfurase/selenocysteine lyase